MQSNHSNSFQKSSPESFPTECFNSQYWPAGTGTQKETHLYLWYERSNLNSMVCILNFKMSPITLSKCYHQWAYKRKKKKVKAFEMEQKLTTCLLQWKISSCRVGPGFFDSMGSLYRHCLWDIYNFLRCRCLIAMQMIPVHRHINKFCLGRINLFPSFTMEEANFASILNSFRYSLVLSGRSLRWTATSCPSLIN